MLFEPDVTDVLFLGVTVTVELPVEPRLFDEEAVVVLRLFPAFVLLLPVVVCLLLLEELLEEVVVERLGVCEPVEYEELEDLELDGLEE